MWPKAISQLIELLPHAARLLPVADKFFQSKTVADDGSRQAFDALAQGIRGDLGQVTAAHATLSRQLAEQENKLALVSANALAARAAAEAAEARLTHLERRLDRIAILLLAVTALAVALVVLSALILHHVR
jgi:hypothetical protein